MELILRFPMTNVCLFLSVESSKNKLEELEESGLEDFLS